MENSIVRDFKKLRVIAACNIEGMDELVNDLSRALEESSTIYKASSADDVYEGQLRPRWKKRVSKRHQNKSLVISGHLTEASESSVDDTNIEFTDCRMQQTDSDDMGDNQHTRLRIPVEDHTFAQTIESDSVAENYSPIRPQRRRRKFKTMAIDPSPDHNCILSDFMFKPKHKKKRSKSLNVLTPEYYLRSASIGIDQRYGFTESMIPGKRKRNSRSRSENYHEGGQMSLDSMDTAGHNDSSSITTSSSDSDFMGVVTNDEAREADDEQSDFFHEAGPSCGIIPVWDRRDVTTPTMDSGSTFEQILRHRAATSSQAGHRCTINHIFDNPDREIRAGKRKLKERKPRYTVTRFIQDRQNWKAMQTKYASCWPRSRVPEQKGEYKRRKAVATSPISTYIEEAFEPVPQYNTGGVSYTSGVSYAAPNVSYRRPRKRVIGSQSHLSSDS